MKRVITLLFFIFCIFTVSSTFQVNYVNANTNDIDIKQELKNEIPTTDSVTVQEDDILDKPIFEDETKQANKNKIPAKITNIVIKAISGICLLILIAICLCFIYMVNKQRQNELKRKKFNGNSEFINSVDNFARRKLK